MKSQHIDDGTSVESFTDLFLVRCPRCGSQAQVNRLTESIRQSSAKLTCTHCVLSQERKLTGWSPTEPFDWFFQLPLWLQTPCCGQLLWAFNLKHLSFIESLVQATHRAGISEENASRLRIRNATLASRLPKWMIVAKNRDEVLKCIDKLRQLALLQQQ